MLVLAGGGRALALSWRCSLALSSKRGVSSKIPGFSAGAVRARMTLVDHIVYIKTKPDATVEQKQAMVDKLQALTSLESVTNLYVGEVHVAEPQQWTHVLYGRHRDKAALQSYAESEEHVAVVTNYIKPILEDICAVDFEAEPLAAGPTESPVEFVQTIVVKTSESQTPGVLQGLQEAAKALPGFIQTSAGINFSARAKGFNAGAVALYSKPVVADLKNAVHSAVEEYIYVDFVPSRPALAKM